MLSSFSQLLYSTVLNGKSNNLLPSYTLLENSNLLYCCITVQYKKNANFSALKFIVLSLMYHALISV